jgi:2-polyprenyl-3-methyl-5-hydroxy-6-metoxy-1,4-benzoquinol methylase
MIPLERAACPICRETGRRSVCVKFDLPIASCRGCGLVLADPRLPESELMRRYAQPEFVAECLVSMRASADAFDIDRVRRHFHIPLELLGDPPRPGARLLDVGCGPGLFIRAAAERGWAGEGVEVSAGLAAYARNIAGVPVREETIESAALSDGAYDAVVLLDVLEHVREPGAVLEKAARILRPGGKLIVGTPDFRSLSRLILGRNWAVLSPAEHLFYFTAPTLARILEGAGFEVRGTANFLVFNSDATHAPGTRRHRLWRNALARMERQTPVKKAQMHDVRRVLWLAGGIGDWAAAGLPKRILFRLYDGFRAVVRRDMLYAVGFKEG